MNIIIKDVATKVGLVIATYLGAGFLAGAGVAVLIGRSILNKKEAEAQAKFRAFVWLASAAIVAAYLLGKRS